MSLVGSFSGAVRGFLDELQYTRRSLGLTALTLKQDARQARSWGFFAVGAVAHTLLTRKQDAIDDHRYDVQSVAERAIWLTHFMTDPELIRATRLQILTDNGSAVSMDELEGYLDKHLDDLPMFGGGQRHQNMLADMHRQRTMPRPTTVPELELN